MIWILLIIFQIKHFVADYLLQNQYMLGKFKERGWVLPLASHCYVHTVFTYIIACACGVNGVVAFGFGLLDFTLHFIMDRVKASPNILGKFKALSKTEVESHYANMARLKAELQSASKQQDPERSMDMFDIINELEQDWKEKLKDNKYFWWSLGLDQMVHHITDIILVFLIVSNI